MKAPRLTSGALGQPGQWNSLVDDAKGSGTLLAHNVLGHFLFGANLTNGNSVTFTVNGTAITLTGKTGTLTTAGDFKIQSTTLLTVTTMVNFLQNPWTTNANQIALSLANQQLLGYIGIAQNTLDVSICSLNTTMQSPLTSFSGSTSGTGTYTADSMKLWVEPGILYIGTTQVNFLGGPTPAVTAPSTNPRIDLLTINTSGVLAWTTGIEAASPVAPAYPFGKVPICEITNVVGETSILDNANQSSSQGYISTDVRPFNNIIYINDPNQIAAGVITNANLNAAVGIVQTGMIMMWSTTSAPTGWHLCDGTAISRTTFSALFAVIGTTFGIGDGSTTFNVPDMRGRVPVGVGTGTGGGASGNGLPTGGSALTARTLGDWLGEETHTLSLSEMPAHSHNVAEASGGGGANTTIAIASVTTSAGTSFVVLSESKGSSSTHNNIQPTMALEFIIHT